MERNPSAWGKHLNGTYTAPGTALHTFQMLTHLTLNNPVRQVLPSPSYRPGTTDTCEVTCTQVTARKRLKPRKSGRSIHTHPLGSRFSTFTYDSEVVLKAHGYECRKLQSDACPERKNAALPAGLRAEGSAATLPCCTSFCPIFVFHFKP